MKATMALVQDQPVLPVARIKKVDGTRWLQTPVYRMDRASDGRRIWLVGMVHYGLPSYYAQTVRLVNEIRQAGAVVLREGGGLKASLLNPASDLTGEERELLEVTNDYWLYHHFLACHSGRIDQSEGWKDSIEDWENVDIPIAVRNRERGDVTAQLEQMRHDLARLRWIAGNTKAIAAWRRRDNLIQYQVTVHLRHTSAEDAHKMVARNRHVIDAALHRDRDVVLPWGTNHLPGFTLRLTQAGFSTAAEQWLNAFTMPNPLWLSLRATATGLRNSMRMSGEQRRARLAAHLNSLGSTAAADRGEDR